MDVDPAQFFMNKFRDLGFIEYNGDIKVNQSLLGVLHDCGIRRHGKVEAPAARDSDRRPPLIKSRPMPRRVVRQGDDR